MDLGGQMELRLYWKGQTRERADWEGFLETVTHKGLSLGNRKSFLAAYVNSGNKQSAIVQEFSPLGTL